MIRNQALRAIFRPSVVRRSLTVSAVIGTVLNLINQGDALLSGHGIIWWRVALTYCVPYAVASYGTYAALLDSVNSPEPQQKPGHR